jgi:hypothetical protein
MIFQEFAENFEQKKNVEIRNLHSQKHRSDQKWINLADSKNSSSTQIELRLSMRLFFKFYFNSKKNKRDEDMRHDDEFFSQI